MNKNISQTVALLREHFLADVAVHNIAAEHCRTYQAFMAVLSSSQVNGLFEAHKAAHRPIRSHKSSCLANLTTG